MESNNETCSVLAVAEQMVIALLAFKIKGLPIMYNA